MKQLLGAVAAMALLSPVASEVRADDKASLAILDKAIKAVGGEARLGKLKAFSQEIKGTITLGGNDNEFTGRSTIQGFDRLRSEFEAEANGNKFQGVTVINGKQGWRKFGEMTTELDKESLANEKRNLYLQFVGATLLPLKRKEYKVVSAGEEKVAGKPAVGIKATGPDGKDFTLHFAKDTGLPVRMVAKVLDFMGNEFTQTTTFDAYKEFDGLKRATRVVSQRDGEKFLRLEVKKFKALAEVDAKTFDEPK